jgi:hypothetical protein
MDLSFVVLDADSDWEDAFDNIFFPGSLTLNRIFLIGRVIIDFMVG